MIGVCALLNMLDGYDLFIMGFAIPYLPAGFGSATATGYLLSAALIGMGVGALVGGPVADRAGRRRLLRVALVVNLVGLVGSALAPGYGVLLVSRFVTGVAVGAITVVIMVLNQEFAPENRRSVAMGMVVFGFPLGNILAGLSAQSLFVVLEESWRDLFWVGAGLAVVMLVLGWAIIPESVAYLHSRGTPAAMAEAARLQARLGLPEGPGPAVEPDPTPQAGLTGILGPRMRARTLLLWVGYLLVIGPFYFVGTWTPALVARMSGDASDGATAGLLVSTGTLAGAVLYALVGLRFSPTKITILACLVAAFTAAPFSSLLGTAWELPLAALLGVGLSATLTGYSGTAISLYPVESRARGYGLMHAAGRIGAITAPIVVGYAVSLVSPAVIYSSLVAPLALSAVAATLIHILTLRAES